MFTCIREELSDAKLKCCNSIHIYTQSALFTMSWYMWFWQHQPIAYTRLVSSIEALNITDSSACPEYSVFQCSSFLWLLSINACSLLLGFLNRAACNVPASKTISRVGMSCSSALVHHGYAVSLVTGRRTICNGRVSFGRGCLCRCLGRWSIYSSVQVVQG
jgi:hypothetical protein